MTVNYKNMHNEELIDLLFTEEDHVTKAVADEILRRAKEMVPVLSEIVTDRLLWTADLPDFWAPIHATYLLGAIGGQNVLTPLLSALRWADAYDNEWVTEDLPSILGSLGDLSWNSLVAVVEDRTAGWSARSIAMDALGSQSLRFPKREEAAMAVLGEILKNPKEDYGARRSAAFVLTDFRRADLKKELIAFAKGETERQKLIPEYKVAFAVEDVERNLTSPRLGLDIYIRNWMDFYSPEEMMRRQEEWVREDGKALKRGYSKKLH